MYLKHQHRLRLCSQFLDLMRENVEVNQITSLQIPDFSFPRLSLSLSLSLYELMKGVLLRTGLRWGEWGSLLISFMFGHQYRSFIERIVSKEGAGLVFLCNNTETQKQKWLRIRGDRSWIHFPLLPTLSHDRSCVRCIHTKAARAWACFCFIMPAACGTWWITK